MSHFEKEDLLDMVDEAQDKLSEVIELVEQVVEAIESPFMESYLLAKLKIRLSDDHGYLTSDPNLDTLRQKVEEFFPKDEEEN